MLRAFNIRVGFSLLIFLILLLGVSALIKIDTLSQQTLQIYQHPFKVSRAAITINSHLISMHRSMKDVVLSRSDSELNEAMTKVDQYESFIQDEYKIIFDNYLGNRSDIEESFQLFVDWKPIRQRVIALVKQERYLDAANITKNEGANHVQALNASVQTLVDFASGKADEFYGNAISNDVYAKRMVVIILVVVLTLAVVIAKVAIFNMDRSLEEKDSSLSKMRGLSITDPLTNVYNRRRFDEVLPKYFRSAKTLDINLVFVILDIDNFKAYNDNYGHQRGDVVLRKVSRVLKTNLKRTDDYVFRIGGEEFALMFSMANFEEVKQRCQGILDAISALGVTHQYNESYGVVTASMGVAVVNEKTDYSGGSVYQFADQLLYRAKRNGRNQFEIDYVH